MEIRRGRGCSGPRAQSPEPRGEEEGHDPLRLKSWHVASAHKDNNSILILPSWRGWSVS